MTNNTQRKRLRIELRNARRAMSQQRQKDAAIAIAEKLFSLSLVRKSSTLAGYLDNDGEVSLNRAISHAWQQNKTITLPVIHPFTATHLLFLQYTPQTTLVLNRFSIAEPALRCPDIVPFLHHDVILMPLVGFDSSGNRLGMGGGFYDRTLSSVRYLSKRPALVGIAHDCQQVDALPTAAWDVPLDAIVTPTQIVIPENR